MLIPILNVLAVVVATLAVVVAYRTLIQVALPSVAIYAEVDRSRPSVVNLIIENMGTAPALNVQFDSSRPIPSKVFGMPGDKPPLNDMNFEDGPFVVGIPVLHPHERRVMTWGQFGGLQRVLGSETISINAQFSYEKPLVPWQSRLSQESRISIPSFAREDISELPDLRTAKALEKMEKRIDVLARALERRS